MEKHQNPVMKKVIMTLMHAGLVREANGITGIRIIKK